MVEVTEHWNPHSFTRKDLFGFGDVMAVKGKETVLVQATSTPNVQSRIRKVRGLDSAGVWLAESSHRRIIVIGWKKFAKKLNGRNWQPTLHEITLPEWLAHHAVDKAWLKDQERKAKAKKKKESA